MGRGDDGSREGRRSVSSKVEGSTRGDDRTGSKILPGSSLETVDGMLSSVFLSKLSRFSRSSARIRDR